MRTYKTQPTLKSRIKNAANSLITAGLISTATLMPMQRAKACTGAEQLGMMGAGGEVLAENPNAAYWNPGLTPKLKSTEVSYYHTFKNDGGNLIIRYDNVFSLATPIGKKGIWGAGAMYVDSSREADLSTDKEFWKILKVVAGARVYDSKQTKAFIGAGIELSKIKHIRDTSATNHVSADLGAVIVRESAIFEGDELRVGILGQSIINVRPSAAYSIKNFNGKGKLTGALTYYNLLNIKDHGELKKEIRLGIRQSLETKIGNISFEAGTGNRKELKSTAFGFAFEPLSKEYKLSCAYLKMKDEKTQIGGRGILLEFTKRF